MIGAQVKEANRKEVFDYMRTKYLRSGEDTSKAEISKRSVISAPTLMKICDFFMQQGLLEAGEEMVVSVGRPLHMLKVRKDCMYAVGFLLEGIYLYMGVVDIFGSIVYRKVLEVQPDLISVLTSVREKFVPELLAEAQIPADKLVGIGLAMPVSYNARTKTASNGPLVGVSKEVYLGSYLEELECRYGVDVFFENDANAECLGVSRALNLFADGGDILLISFGTGIGAALMLEGTLRRGYHERCGEIGDSIAVGWSMKPDHTLEHQISLDSLSKKYRLTYYEAIREMPERMREQVVGDIARRLAVLVHNANSLVDCRDLVICGYGAELLGERLLDEVNRCLDELEPGRQRPRLRMESPFSGISGIAGRCIENHVQQIMKL